MRYQINLNPSISKNVNGPLPPQSHHQPMILGNSSDGEENPKAPKKWAETWVQEETRTLISLRREIDSLFNTSKSNKHLWDQISAKMREKGFDRSLPSSDPKMSYYKEIEGQK